MLIRVLEIAEPTGNFHFGSGEPQTFMEVDWFRDDQPPGPWNPSVLRSARLLANRHEQPMEPDSPGMMETEEGRAQIADFVKGKRYYDPAKSYLVLHPGHSFTINYSAP